MLVYSGKRFDLNDYENYIFSIEEIAHALSMLCRFNGHTTTFYSVAQHSVLVAEILPKKLKLHGLLHDAAEAYLGDLVSPIKAWLPDFSFVEDSLLAAILSYHNIKPHVPGSTYALHAADKKILGYEIEDLLIGQGASCKRDQIVPAPPEEAEEMFIDAYKELKCQS